MSSLFCRVCGYENSEPPWGEDGESPCYGFCPCCGVEAGYQDYTVESAKEFRDSWIQAGAKWDMPWLKPADWSLEKQLNNIPEEFK